MKRLPNPAEPLLSVQEVAAYCKVSTKTIRRAIAKGELDAGRAGVQWRATRAAVRRYLMRSDCGEK